MHTAKYTPGPWQKSPYEDSTTIWAGGDGIGGGVCLVTDVFDRNGGKRTEEAMANASILAAAEQMLRTLKEVRRSYGAPKHALTEGQRKAMLEVEATIAKAEGRSYSPNEGEAK